MNEDKNIYFIYEEGKNYPKEVKWNNNSFDLTKMTKKEAIDAIRKLYPNLDDDYNHKKIYIITKKEHDLKSLEEAVKKSIDLKAELSKKEEAKKVKSTTQVDSNENTSASSEESSEDQNDEQEDSKKKLSKKQLIGIGVSAAIIAGLVWLGVTLEKSKAIVKDSGNSLTSETTEKTVKELAIENTKLSLENFNILASKYNIDNKQIGITAEEWLTAYIYANAKDYKTYELLDILRENPEFYSNMSNNYRSWCEAQTYYNIIADETSLTKDFFKNEESYKIYTEYFNLFKKAQKDPTKENRTALNNKTNEFFGLKDYSIDNTIELPGTLSVMGHTITTSAHLLGLINEETYMNAMYKEEKDKNGNIVRNHGPIEMATCEYIENQRLDILNNQILIFDKEDTLTSTFIELNEKYNNLKTANKLLNEETVFNKIAEIRKAINDKINPVVVNNNKTDKKVETTTPKTEKITEKEAKKDFSEEEIIEAEEKAEEEFEEKYENKIAQQEAKKEGLIDARDWIEKLLTNASQSLEASRNYSESDIETIKNSLINSYNGDYKSYYTSGVKEATSWGITELNSIKKQLEDAAKELIISEETIIVNDSTTIQETTENEFVIPEDTTEIVPVTQAELDNQDALVRTK